MTKRRTRLIAARIEAGYKSQGEFVTALRKDKSINLDISSDSYSNLESGRNKNVDVVIAFAIAKKLGRTVEEIFLPITTQKIHQNNSDPNSAA